MSTCDVRSESIAAHRAGSQEWSLYDIWAPRGRAHKAEAPHAGGCGSVVGRDSGAALSLVSPKSDQEANS